MSILCFQIIFVINDKVPMLNCTSQNPITASPHQAASQLFASRHREHEFANANLIELRTLTATEIACYLVLELANSLILVSFFRLLHLRTFWPLNKCLVSKLTRC